MNDVEPRLYTTVVREMVRHENDVTNHRIMWLLIGQGLIANAYVSAGNDRESVVAVLSTVGILLTMSAFVILYKSYQARGYLQFLGNEAKRGTLREEELPILGWPAQRIQGWRRKVWVCPWLEKPSDLLEPFFFLPGLLAVAWMFVLASHQWQLSKGILLIVCLLLTFVLFAALCVLWVRSQSRYEQLRRS